MADLTRETDWVSKRVTRLERQTPIKVDVPNVNKMDFRMVNRYPNRTGFTAIQNDGKVFECRIVDGRIHYSALALNKA